MLFRISDDRQVQKSVIANAVDHRQKPLESTYKFTCCFISGGDGGIRTFRKIDNHIWDYRMSYLLIYDLLNDTPVAEVVWRWYGVP
jgi:hypothetical protein